MQYISIYHGFSWHFQQTDHQQRLRFSSASLQALALTSDDTALRFAQCWAASMAMVPMPPQRSSICSPGRSWAKWSIKRAVEKPERNRRHKTSMISIHAHAFPEKNHQIFSSIIALLHHSQHDDSFRKKMPRLQDFIDLPSLPHESPQHFSASNQ